MFDIYMPEVCDLIVALDYKDAEAAKQFVELLHPENCVLKVGFELFVAAGPGFVRELVKRDFRVFLDLKFHDIPNTVSQACLRAADMGVWMMNVHACGGDKMMMAAKQALQSRGFDTHLIAVTVLTSMDQQQLMTINIQQSPQEQVLALAKLTNEAGLDGVVCSAREAAMLRENLPIDFMLVTPGIRPAGADLNDQSRVMTPEEARQSGVNAIVVGRPIIQADKPLGIIKQINESLT